MAADEYDSPGGSQSALRRSNQRKILDVLRRTGPTSQAALARTCGLSRSAVNVIIRSLSADGLVAVTAGVNGRETEVALVTTTGAVLAIDLGHRRLHGVLFDFESKRRRDEVVDLGGSHEAQTDVEAVARLVDRLLDRGGVSRDDVLSVCVALHAPYESISHRISGSGIWPGWRGLDVEGTLRERLALPVIVDNDANLAALAEWTWGPGRGADELLYAKCANGIGSGLVLGGRIFGGSNGMAGELGHIVVDDREALCNCGNRGCLSAVASGRALRLKLAAAGEPKESLLEVITAARAGDPACRRLLGESGRAIGFALAHAVKLIAPSVIVIGGEMAAADTMLLDPMRSELEANLLDTVSGPPRLERGIRRADVSVLGCAARVLADAGSGVSELPAWMLTPAAQPAKERV